MMNPKRQAALLAYCRLEADELTDDEMDLLESMYQASLSYMEQAGISEPESDTQRRRQYDLCVNCLTLDAWDRRSMTASGSALTDNPGFRRIMNQLKLTDPILSASSLDVSDPDTSKEDRGNT